MLCSPLRSIIFPLWARGALLSEGHAGLYPRLITRASRGARYLSRCAGYNKSRVKKHGGRPFSQDEPYGYCVGHWLGCSDADSFESSTHNSCQSSRSPDIHAPKEKSRRKIAQFGCCFAHSHSGTMVDYYKRQDGAFRGRRRAICLCCLLGTGEPLRGNPRAEMPSRLPPGVLGEMVPWRSLQLPFVSSPILCGRQPSKKRLCMDGMT